MASTYFIALVSSIFLFWVLPSNVSAISEPPKTKKTDGTLQCELHVPEILNAKDVTDEYLRKLFAKCKPDASDAELREAYKYLHELQKDEAEEENAKHTLPGTDLE